jgi:hypothetical protein
MGLLRGGLGMLANAYVPPGYGSLGGIGAGGLMGLEGYQQSLADQQAAEQQAIKEQMASAEFQMRKAEFNEQVRQQQAIEQAIQELPPEQQKIARLNPKAFAESLIPKPAVQTELAKLITERDQLASNDPRRQIYNEAIRKQSTFAPPQRVVIENYPQPMPAIGPSGQPELIQFGSQGSVSPTGYKPVPKPEDIRLTEGEATATSHYMDMISAKNALTQLNSNMADLRTQMSVEAAKAPILNPMVNATEQQINQAQEQWVGAKIYHDTGKAATLDEVRKKIQTYFPRVGDKPAVIEQKKKAREDAEKAVEIAAGRGVKKLGNLVSPPSKPKSDEKREKLIEEAKRRGLIK